MLNIFKLKSKDKTSLVVNNNDVNFVSQTRYYPPSSKEWFNSIYAYNKDSTKLLPINDRVVINLIRGYFNLYSRKLEKKLKWARMRTWMRRLSTNKILVSRAELNHSSDKVHITIYLYNRQKKHIIKKIKKIRLFLFSLVNAMKLLNKKNLKILEKYLESTSTRYLINRRNLRNLNLKRKFNRLELEQFNPIIFKESKKLNNLQRFVKSVKLIRNEELEMFNIKISILKAKALKIISEVRKEKNIITKALAWDDNNFKNYEKIYNNRFLKKSLQKEIIYMYYKQILFLNKYKFNNSYLLPLKTLVNKLYNKKVVFNIVSLKYFYLNSDILTQILVSKIRNRKNRVLKVLKACIRGIKLPSINRFSVLDKVYNRKTKLQNVIVKNLFFDRFYIKNISKTDVLDNILSNYLPISLKKNFTEYLKNIVLKNKSLKKKYKIIFLNFASNYLFNKPLSGVVKKKYDIFCRNTVINSLKHKVVNGVRIEASGRLTRRITAARSIFKLRYIGNLQNTDSSHKGLSSTILRGHFKSNLQYTVLSSKRRIGSFGLKGWVNSN